MPLQAPIEQASASPEHQLDALLHTVGIHPIEDIGWIRVTGSDRVRWLNGMVTNSIQALKPGEGNYSFALNSQGQIQGDLTTFAEQNALLVQTARDRVPSMIAMFDRFIIMDDVELEDISPTRFGLQIIGPQAVSLLTRIGVLVPPPPVTLATVPWHDTTIQLLAAHSPLVPRFEIWTDEHARAILQSHFAELGALLVDFSAIENLRILERTPRYGTDIREKHLPQETSQTRALHFSKGCYLGQEIVERIRSRGNVHRAFTAFLLEGPLPPAGTAVSAEGKPVAELTSVAAIPFLAGHRQIGLGLARREPIERALTLTYATEDGQGTAIPVSLLIHR